MVTRSRHQGVSIATEPHHLIRDEIFDLEVYGSMSTEEKGALVKRVKEAGGNVAKLEEILAELKALPIPGKATEADLMRTLRSKLYTELLQPGEDLPITAVKALLKEIDSTSVAVKKLLAERRKKKAEPAD